MAFATQSKQPRPALVLSLVVALLLLSELRPDVLAWGRPATSNWKRGQRLAEMFLSKNAVGADDTPANYRENLLREADDVNLLVSDNVNGRSAAPGEVSNAPQPFIWKDCSPPSSPVRVKSFSLTPPVVYLNTNLSVFLDVQLPGPLSAPLQLRLGIYKKVGAGVWQFIPCYKGVGSCTYSDFCAVLAKHFPGPSCPAWFMGRPCRCPVPPEIFPLKMHFPVSLPPAVPAEFAIGPYGMHIDMQGKIAKGGSFHLCLQMNVTVAQ